MLIHILSNNYFHWKSIPLKGENIKISIKNIFGHDKPVDSEVRMAKGLKWHLFVREKMDEY